jgi:YesN/AraC family two-component response regulator
LPRTILLSAFWNDRVARSAMRLGVDECLSKPCRAEVLFRLIRDIGAERRTAHAARPTRLSAAR